MKGVWKNKLNRIPFFSSCSAGGQNDISPKQGPQTGSLSSNLGSECETLKRPLGTSKVTAQYPVITATIQGYTVALARQRPQTIIPDPDIANPRILRHFSTRKV